MMTMTRMTVRPQTTSSVRVDYGGSDGQMDGVME